MDKRYSKDTDILLGLWLKGGKALFGLEAKTGCLGPSWLMDS
jgi:hypothetical protein